MDTDIKKYGKCGNTHIPGVVCKICKTASDKIYRQTHKKEAKAYKQAHAEIISQQSKKYREEHIDEEREWNNNYIKTRREVDLQFKLQRNMRPMISKLLTRSVTDATAIKSVGCTKVALITYLESKFYPNPQTGESMTWENRGKGNSKWHVDHINSLVNFDLTNPEEVQRDNHYTNLQPLWALDHRTKTLKELESKKEKK